MRTTHKTTNSTLSNNANAKQFPPPLILFSSGCQLYEIKTLGLFIHIIIYYNIP